MTRTSDNHCEDQPEKSQSGEPVPEDSWPMAQVLSFAGSQQIFSLQIFSRKSRPIILVTSCVVPSAFTQTAQVVAKHPADRGIGDRPHFEPLFSAIAQFRRYFSLQELPCIHALVARKQAVAGHGTVCPPLHPCTGTRAPCNTRQTGLIIAPAGTASQGSGPAGGPGQ